MSENWQNYICEYRHDGAEWGVEIVALSSDDARRRLRSIGMTGQVKGEIAFKVPITLRLPRAVTLALMAILVAAVGTSAVAWLAGLHQ